MIVSRNTYLTVKDIWLMIIATIVLPLSSGELL